MKTIAMPEESRPPARSKRPVAALVFCLLFVSSVPAHAKRPFTSDTIWDWRTVADPQISTDGKSVLYVLGFNDKMNDAQLSNIWLATADGKEQRPITHGSFKDASPRWSPDGGRIAYVSNRSGKPQIYVRWMDTGQEAKISELQQAPTNISWSPDGKWIAYVSRVPAKPAWSVNMPEKPADAKWAPPPIVVTRLKWRADAAGLIQPGYQHIFIIPAEGGAPRQISSGDFDHNFPSGAGAPAWTPDGKWILTTALRVSDADYELEGPEIYAFSVQDGAVKQLTHRKGPDYSPVVSPDGKKIAYAGYDFKHQSYTVTNLYVMDADGSNPRLLTANHDRDVDHLHWSANSQSVYFVSEERGSSQLYAVNLDGAVKRITSGTHRFTSYASSEPFSISSGGRVALIRSTPADSPDVFTFTVDQPSQWTRLTSVNGSLLADRDLGKVEEFSFDSFDGKTIQGWIVKPPGFDPSQKYPLILDIHGGPHAMYGVEFGNQMQMYAARGFVVLYTNPRGSTGYGEEFGNIIHTRYPGDDFKDLMAGVDAVLAKGYVDPKRLAVTGGSGGGLLTAWIIGHTDRFAAAVSQYPVTDWITMAGTADMGYYFAAVWMKAMPWDKPEQYLERSPIFFAKNFKTPTMVITGEEDYRTPISQSEELYFALKARKVDSVLIRIPDEPHGIRGGHPSHRIAKVEHVLGWIEKHTPAAGP